MLTTEEQRAEAERLVGLDERGLLVEEVALAIRLGDQQEQAMSELVAIDREFIEEVAARGGQRTTGVSDEGPGPGPAGEHLDA